MLRPSMVRMLASALFVVQSWLTTAAEYELAINAPRHNHHPNSNAQAYGDPATGCRPGEADVTIQGMTNASFCSPKCISQSAPVGHRCPPGPPGATAEPMCTIREPGSTGPPDRCSLVCHGLATGSCPSGSTCKIIGLGMGACFFPTTAAGADHDTGGEDRRTIMFDRSVPVGWELASVQPLGTDLMALEIPLRLADGGAAVRAAASARSDPGNPRYGRWLSRDEVEALSPALPGAHDAVRAWLAACGVSDEAVGVQTSALRVAAASVDEVRCLLGTDVAGFVRSDDGARHMAVVGAVSVPMSVRPFVPFLPGVADFPLAPRRARAAANRSRSDVRLGAGDGGRVDKGVVAPKTLASLYNVPSGWYDTEALANTTLLVAEFLSESAYEPTYVFGGGKEPGFFSEAGLPTPRGGAGGVTKVGTFKPDGGELEAELDVQYAFSTARGVSMAYWTEEAWMYEFATALLAGKGGVSAASVDVCSISFTWSEAAECTQPSGAKNPVCTELKVQSREYVQRVNTEFAKLAAMGVTVVVSSGDDGAPGDKGTCSPGSTLDSSFPAASPWVTTVGATMLSAQGGHGKGEVAKQGSAAGASDPICSDNPPGCATSTHEIACTYPASGITTGGGFSVFEARPSWQDAAVQTYLSRAASSLPSAQVFNRSGRAYPDLSVVGNNYAVYFGQLGGEGFWIPTDGTSASTPVAAGIFAMITSQLGRRLGHVAPLLYKLPSSSSALKDIVEGSNRCKSTCCGKSGFQASKGWDPVTGLGTIDAAAMFKALSSITTQARRTKMVLDTAGSMAHARNSVAPRGAVEANKTTHYGDPKDGCLVDETVASIGGLQGDVCAPQCTSAGACPQDMPSGVVATPDCALTSPEGQKYCVLLCKQGTDDQVCGSNASCKPVSGKGVCTYDD